MTATTSHPNNLTTTINENPSPKRQSRRKAVPTGSHQVEKPANVAPRTTGKKPAATESKTDVVLKKLRAPKGATVAKLIEATGWQAHSVRGFLSGTVRKKLGLALSSDVGKDGVRRYRIANQSVVS